MTPDTDVAPPYFHEESGAVRFWVRTPDGSMVGAIARKQLLHFRFRGEAAGGDALATYQAHHAEIDAAVLRRVAAGSIEPVLLREADFAPRSAGV